MSHWMRTLAALVFSLTLVGCSNVAPAVPPAPTATPPGSAGPALTPTPGPVATTTASTNSVDYKAICQPLLLPLGALIVAVRANTPTTTYWLAQFNQAADKVLPAIEGDASVNANRLRTSILNVRAMPNNLQVLEDSRSQLLQVG